MLCYLKMFIIRNTVTYKPDLIVSTRLLLFINKNVNDFIVSERVWREQGSDGWHCQSLPRRPPPLWAGGVGSDGSLRMPENDDPRIVASHVRILALLHLQLYRDALPHLRNHVR